MQSPVFVRVSLCLLFAVPLPFIYVRINLYDNFAIVQSKNILTVDSAVRLSQKKYILSHLLKFATVAIVILDDAVVRLNIFQVNITDGDHTIGSLNTLTENSSDVASDHI